ncbi:acetyl-CoA synthetase-like protein [Pleomassaria siparia CBS 279.74]|uniref:Acetyl-CoA synthetase-like protein n=1 Tax=Pleomassaria siparia CBS 279.74 TaxID=1314801 RepID=A0A6G1KCR6_9PLEO|nr:acetyl-CoA synthetase-like protein [Pleomassaria siparia CBS 279.74]
MAFWDTVMAGSGQPSDGVMYGKRLIPVIVDEIAAKDPERICFAFPRSLDPAQGFQNVNFRTFANAINKTAQFIQREIGRSAMFETVMYMGYSDVRHFIALVALMKTGHKVLYSSHRNSVAGHADLIHQTGCTILLSTPGFSVSDILEKCSMETLCMPEMEYLLDDSIVVDPYPYKKDWDAAKHHPCLIVHTPGSTGFPKPVVWTQSSLTTSDAHQVVSPLDGRRCLWNSVMDATRRAFSGYPIFHGSGIAVSITKATSHNSVVVLGPPGIVDAHVFDEILEHGDIHAADCLPIALEEVATRPEILAKLGRLNYITYAGGVLSKTAGDAISQHVPLYALMASTETNFLVQHTTDREDWQYICLNLAYNGIEMRPHGHLSELVFVKDSEHAALQGIFKVYPRLTEYSMGDLYSKHPTKSNHCNGWNFNPTIHEHLITSHPTVHNRILVGTGRDRPVAVVELRPEFYTEDEKGRNRLLDFLWSKINEANNEADSMGPAGTRSCSIRDREKAVCEGGEGDCSEEGHG